MFLALFPVLYSVAQSSSGNNEPATVYFLRLKSLTGSTANMTIQANDKPIVRLKNASYFKYTVPAGKYIFSFTFGSDTKTTLNLESGKEYYIQCYYNPGKWSSVPVMLQLEGLSGKLILDENDLTELSPEPVTVRYKSHAGLIMTGGIGFQTVPLFVDEDNNDVTLSAGGGFSIGLNYGYQVGKSIDLELGAEFRNSNLSEKLNNAKASFNRLAIAFTPSVIIPFRNESMCLRAGAGPGFYSMATMKIDGSEINNSVYKFKYNSAIGFQVQLLFEAKVMERGSMDVGLRYNNAKYELNQESSSHYLTDPELKNPDGSSIDFVIGYNLMF
jgi:hypothetical protein